MALNVGDRLGHYDVAALIGEGGMGEVYRATDTQLGRDVALKILPDAFAADPDRLARFQREAQLLASLNHQNIAQIHGIEEDESSGTRALVLELVEGPTLADRIAKGPIPLDEALPIAKQIAEALEAAHGAGMIHRDLKPANIKVREDGTVKVLDFGLATFDKTREGDPSQSPTQTAVATQTGVILGTAAYMSPEQASGTPVDKRADIWSFGAVLFEMLTGKRAFGQGTVAATLARVIERDADFGALPPNVPEPIRRLLRRSLAKERKQRLPDIAAARLELDEAMSRSPSSVMAPTTEGTGGWRQAWPLALGVASVLVLISALVAALVVRSAGRAAGPPLSRFTVSSPPSAGVSADVVSPDGRTIAFANDITAQDPAYVRRLDALEAVPLRGAEGANPFGFSPDGEWVLVSDGSVLKRVPVAGGPAVTIADDPFLAGADWGPGDVIVSGSPDGLWTVSASGGEHTQQRPPAESESGAYYMPRFLPNGRAVLFYIWNDSPSVSQVAVYDRDTGQQKILLSGTSPQFATSGHVVFFRDGSLWAVRFDPDRLEVKGEPRPVVDGVGVNPLGVAFYSLARGGTLIYRQSESGWGENLLVFRNRNGGVEPIESARLTFARWPRLSPDGQRLAVTAGPAGAGDIWIVDLSGGAQPLQLTFEGNDGYPIWRPDGQRVAFTSVRGADADLYEVRADGSERDATLLLAREGMLRARDWFDDGRRLLFEEIVAGTSDIGIYADDTSQAEIWLDTEFVEINLRLSPDGRLVAYESDRNGRGEHLGSRASGWSAGSCVAGRWSRPRLVFRWDGALLSAQRPASRGAGHGHSAETTGGTA